LNTAVKDQLVLNLQLKQNANSKEVDTMTPEKNNPLATIRAGAVKSTIWENRTQKDGKEISYQTISLERIYKDKDDKWQSTNSFRVNDLPKAALALRKAYEYIVLKREEVVA
jgi:hypothetical protein